MFSRLISRLTGVNQSELYALRLENRSLKHKLEAAEKVAREFEQKSLKKSESKLPIPVDIGDPAPKDEEERREYVARVAELHTDILKPKFVQMISSAHSLLEDPELPEATQRSIQGTVYCLRELILWGDQKVNERIADVANSDDDEDDEESEDNTQ